MSTNNYCRVFLKAKEEKEILQGFPWVFDNEISHIKHRKENKADGEWLSESFEECTVKNGTPVEVCTKAGGFLGTGILNRNSKISVRIISREHADKVFSDIDGFWKQKIKDACALRSLYFSQNDSYRLVFGEADLIPGLICERYCSTEGKVLILVQFLSMSCDVFRKEILNAIIEECKPDAIYERSDASVREKEGLANIDGFIDLKTLEVIPEGKASKKDGNSSRYTPDKITILENGIKLDVDIKNGQKTGYFLDQKFNRVAAASFCKGKRVLDTFTHTGAFGLNDAKNGAKQVISADISPEAVELVKKNIAMNGFEDRMTAVCADVFDLLKEYESKGEKFDVIILDPPAFTKSAKMIEKAYGGYKEINLRAMKLLNRGGILVTCSCSYFMESTMFCDMIMHAASDSKKQVQILEKRGAAPDHPLLTGYPKSEYLKCVICRVL